jgi:hypothetical protein
LTNLPAERRPEVDNKKWVLNHNTGEYHRIQRRHAGGIITDSWTYAERKFHHYERRRDLGLHVAGGLSVFAIALVVYLFMLHQGGVLASIAIYLFIMFGGIGVVAALYSACEWLYHALTRNDSIGPSPIPVPGREQVEQQKVHGDGRMMSRDEMHQALRSSTRGAAQKQTFED